MSKGWFKYYRMTLDNPIICKDKDYFTIWNYLLICAAFSETSTIFNGKRILLNPGQLITGRKKLAEKWGINEHKIDRILKAFENEQQIEQQMSSVSRLISITNWGLYQNDEQQNEQQMSSECATFEQPLSTIIRIKEYNKEEYIDTTIPNGIDSSIETEVIVKPKKLKRTREKKEITPMIVNLSTCEVSGNEWKSSFDVYKSGLRQCYRSLKNNQEWLAERKRLNPRIDVLLTLDKVCIDYWATEEGWKKKKKSQSDTINWKTTLAKGIGNKLNYVYENGNNQINRGNALTTEYLSDLTRRAMQTN